MKIVHVDTDGSVLIHMPRTEFNLAAGVNGEATAEPGDEYPIRPIFRFARQLRTTLTALVAELEVGTDSLVHAAKTGDAEASSVTTECGIEIAISDDGRLTPKADFYDPKFAHKTTCTACRAALESKT